MYLFIYFNIWNVSYILLILIYIINNYSFNLLVTLIYINIFYLFIFKKECLYSLIPVATIKFLQWITEPFTTTEVMWNPLHQNIKLLGFKLLSFIFHSLWSLKKGSLKFKYINTILVTNGMTDGMCGKFQILGQSNAI